jgi:acyl carrier protein
MNENPQITQMAQIFLSAKSVDYFQRRWKMNTATVLKEYIQERWMHGAGHDLEESQDLLAAGIIDSLGILQLVTFIEEKFHVQVPDEDVTIENFHSLQAMTAYLASRT